jgi:hypothetical protein
MKAKHELKKIRGISIDPALDKHVSDYVKENKGNYSKLVVDFLIKETKYKKHVVKHV